MIAKKRIALIYDFDDTLVPDTAIGVYLRDHGVYDMNAFWDKCDEHAVRNDMDSILAFMYVLLQQMSYSVKLSDLQASAKNIEFFSGVVSWFDNIGKLANDLGIDIYHYVISSGLREMIHACKIGKHFDGVFASGFLYNDNGIAHWPSSSVNYTTKVQYLFRINKGIMNYHNDNSLNEYTTLEKRFVLFENMIYLGDGYTDIPSMKVVKSKGGHAIAVCKGHDMVGKANCKNIMLDGRVTHYAEADFNPEGELYKLIKDIVTRMSNR